MRFEFCGNVACPEWFIAQISVLTKITAVKMKLIFAQLINYFIEGVDISSKVNKLLAGTGLDFYQNNAVVATLEFILKNSVAYQVHDGVLQKQLIDLGLPKQNVEAITKTYKNSKQKLFAKSTDSFMKMTSQIKLQYNVHEFMGSLNCGNFLKNNKKSIKFAECSLKYKNIDNEQQNVSMLVHDDTLRQLTFSLEQALSTILKMQENIK